MNYRFLDHTADARVECTGATFAELLEAAARALAAVAFRHVANHGEEVRRVVSIKANGPEDAIVRWLQELIYLMDVERLAPVRFEFRQASAQSIEAVVDGCLYQPEDRQDEVKAATYHGMDVRQTETGWRAEVIFDL
ncbi:MAG TPA: archease [Candidatus Hydrogenedentes bacterium]|jgi:SHS2 domain-containing protein|nr:archease [Candidatus Hydrogenedentota bacterium]HPJ98362.1 archease [Candidatus Hydrogenedentota bacterium]